MKSVTTPIVSVIIPAYNTGEYVADAINSVIRQTLLNTEIIVVDDGSTDNTIGMIKNIDDPRIRLIEADHQGASAARNRGLNEATGEYIQFLDSDDILSPDKIEMQLEVLLRANDKKTIASCAWLKFGNNIDEAELRPETVWTVEDPVEWLVCSLSGGGMMQPGVWLAHRDLLQAAGPWDESLSLHDDGEFFTRVLLQADRQVFVLGARVYYRSVLDSLSRKRCRKAIESAYRVCQSRDMHLLARRNDQKARRAIATQYAQFLYEFSGETPDLGKAAIERMAELGAKPLNVVGGQTFRRLAKVVGFKAAISARNMARSLR